MKAATKLAIPVLLTATISFAETNTAAPQVTETLQEAAVNETTTPASTTTSTENMGSVSAQPAETSNTASPTDPTADYLPSAEPEITPQAEPQTTPITGITQSAVKVNVVEVNETFYKLTFDPESNIYQRKQITEAKPGDLIELVISAENKSDSVLTDIELVNLVPEGPVQLLLDSIRTNEEDGQYRVSRDGKTYFPADADFDPEDINFIQWVIYSMQPGDTHELAYRISINR
ncbi:hypothetical protein [Reinekea marinisedimentorum]|uniref:Repeat protein (TIGR01451 family) n=1 Tax=Reinekea marinisedimentorum TaxID=230495 RepID=A0A4R3I6W5_9GAMM|nr:hypothetical protein [Reinekea marinisedimentorum]TCS41433.1 hypothetical protein BCF53_106164 [Reinekea marinisedimentorum]